ncbi:MAG: MurR/RpiR family transcriptional regulator [Geminicoccaceae bacterium]
MPKDVLVAVEAALADLPGALARVGTYVLAEPDETVGASMAELAARSGCGEASIVRFCRHLGFDGFREFRIALASDIAYAKGARVHDATALPDRIVKALYSTSSGLSDELLLEVARRLVAARHIDVFGSGISGYVAEIFAYRFSRLGLVARTFRDPVVAEEVSDAIGADSVFVAISETGLTAHTLDFLSIARDRGAYTVAVSGRRLSPISELCDAVLLTTRLSPLPERGETSPAIAKIYVCELLAQRIIELREQA